MILTLSTACFRTNNEHASRGLRCWPAPIQMPQLVPSHPHSTSSRRVSGRSSAHRPDPPGPCHVYPRHHMHRRGRLRLPHTRLRTSRAGRSALVSRLSTSQLRASRSAPCMRSNRCAQTLARTGRQRGRPRAASRWHSLAVGSNLSCQGGRGRGQVQRPARAVGRPEAVPRCCGARARARRPSTVASMGPAWRRWASIRPGSSWSRRRASRTCCGRWRRA